MRRPHFTRIASAARSRTSPNWSNGLGRTMGCLHWDLLKIIFCHECRGAGRDDRNLQFTNHAVTPDKRNGLDALSLT